MDNPGTQSTIWTTQNKVEKKTEGDPRCPRRI